MRLLAVSLTCALATPGFAAVGAAPSPTQPTPVVDAAFECSIPPSWYVERRAGGLSARGPKTSDGLAAVISVRYVGPGASEKTPEAYMARLTQKPVVQVRGWRIGSVEAARVAGRKSKRLVSDTSQTYPPESMDGKKVLMREEHVAVPAAKGYYALVFYAPRALYEEERADFLKVLESFRPKL